MSIYSAVSFASTSAGTCSHPTTGSIRPAMVTHPQMPHTNGVGRADPAQHHHYGEHGRSWPLDRKSAPLFPRDISRLPGAPSKKRKRCQSPPHKQLSKPTSNAKGPRSPKHRVATAERTPLADRQQHAIVEQVSLLFKESLTSLESPVYNPNMATSFRQCVQQYVDQHHLALSTSYYRTGPSHAQLWRAQIIITQRLRNGQEHTLVNHTSAQWYLNQADAKEATSIEVWGILHGRR